MFRKHSKTAGSLLHSLPSLKVRRKNKAILLIWGRDFNIFLSIIIGLWGLFHEHAASKITFYYAHYNYLSLVIDRTQLIAMELLHNLFYVFFFSSPNLYFKRMWEMRKPTFSRCLFNQILPAQKDVQSRQKSKSN